MAIPEINEASRNTIWIFPSGSYASAAILTKVSPARD